ncbi:hypothetical protein N0V83_000120 [Neocucurbitaria cava]|uniref:Putative gamma-glutamylcyclotransferase n=1 Tax=Neocucurbitaria cava TaxID=798079 RepID=A0A9W8YGG6_9PLEO|nr:hypothetical protein N0V83_000120 [Neocucurbitaria cava]
MDLTTLYAHQHRRKPPSQSLSPPKPSSTMSSSHTAFFYGTLMAPPVLHRVIWGASSPPTPAHASLLRIRPAILHAHQRHKVKHADYPAVLPSESPSSTVRGTLVEGLTDGDIWRLDIFEGSEYERKKVNVRVLRGRGHNGDAGGEQQQATTDELVHGQGEEEKEVEVVEAETYIWTAGAHRLEAAEWDFAEFTREKMKRWVGAEAAETDEGFQEVDDAVAALQQQEQNQNPTGGRGANGVISQQLKQGGKAEDTILESAV